MTDKTFSSLVTLINSELKNFDINRAFNSIGFNIFFEFGQAKEIMLSSRTKDTQKEWIIWISNASWRISQSGKYIVGSGDASETIQEMIQLLLKKHFISLEITSHFLDLEIKFEDHFQLDTFFNWKEENQWTLFFPDQTTIRTNCSNEKEIEHAQFISNQLSVKNNYKKLDLPLENVTTIQISDGEQAPTLLCKDNISIDLGLSVWRLKKNGKYVVGYFDGDEYGIKEKLSVLIGKKLLQIKLSDSQMDAQLHFDDHYVLETFCCCKDDNQLKICHFDNCCKDDNQLKICHFDNTLFSIQIPETGMTKKDPKEG